MNRQAHRARLLQISEVKRQLATETNPVAARVLNETLATLESRLAMQVSK